MTWLLLWCHRHTEIAGFTGAIVLDGTVVVLLLNARRIGRGAARLGRLLAAAYLGSDLHRKPATYHFASDPAMRAAYRRDMDRNRWVTRADRRWLKRELRGLDRIAALYSDSEEAQR